MLLDNLRSMSDRLTGKYGNTIVLHEVMQSGVNLDTGLPVVNETPHNIKAVAMPYDSSEIIDNVVNIDDVKFLIYAFDFEVTKNWYITMGGNDYAILHIKKTTIQDGNIIYELQGRMK